MQKVLPIIVGIILIGVGVFFYVSHENLIKKCTVEAEAVVVDMKEELDTDSTSSMYIYYPIIEYTANDKNMKVTMKDGSSNPKYSVGDKLTILYNPDKENEYVIKGESSISIISIVFAGMGLLVTIAGIAALVKKN